MFETIVLARITNINMRLSLPEVCKFKKWNWYQKTENIGRGYKRGFNNNNFKKLKKKQIL